MRMASPPGVSMTTPMPDGPGLPSEPPSTYATKTDIPQPQSTSLPTCVSGGHWVKKIQLLRNIACNGGVTILCKILCKTRPELTAVSPNVCYSYSCNIDKQVF